jgi:molybdopterin-containing oxidoreductase family iron-sulfur binding subunit
MGKQKHLKRRDFFKIAATSGAAVALASCKDPVETILPNVFPPDNYQVGIPLHFASVCRECPMQCGIVVKTREARAIKVEGNPNHPTNQGRLCAIGQSSLQTLYNPRRIKKALVRGKQVTSKEAEGVFLKKITDLVSQNQADKVLLLHAGGDSTLQRMVKKITDAIGAKNLPLSFDSATSIREANKILFGKNEVPDYSLHKADFLLNFGADFLESWVNPLKHTREFTEFRAYKKRKKNEYVHIAPHLSITGAQADDWVSCGVKSEEAIALSFVRVLAENSNTLGAVEKEQILSYTENFSITEAARQYGLEQKKLQQIVQKLQNKKSLVIGGGNVNATGNQTKLQIAIALLNYLIGAEKSGALQFGANYQLGQSNFRQIQETLKQAQTGGYKLVVLVDLNVDYMLANFPRWKEIYAQTSVVSLSLSHNETTENAEIVIPILSSFEDWGDSFVRAGIYALQQPVMAKLPDYDAKSVGDIFLALAKKLSLAGEFEKSTSFLAYLKAEWQSLQKSLSIAGSFEVFWKNSLQKGGVFRNYEPKKAVLQAAQLPAASAPAKAAGLSLISLNSNIQASSGNTGDKYWLLEIPHPMTQVVWDSWLEIHPQKAAELDIRHADEVEVTTKQGSVKLAAYIYDFIDKDTVSMPTGLGRKINFPNYSSRKSMLFPFSKDRKDSLVEKKVGENALEVLPFGYDDSGEHNFFAENIQIKKTGKKFFLVTSDGQYKDDIKALKKDAPAGYGDRSQKGRHLIQSASVKELNTGKIKKQGHHLKERHYTTNTQNVSDFYKERKRSVSENIFGLQGNNTPKYYDPYKFEMTIDLNKCTGCSACVVACYAENNIAVVGKERQAVGREMSWLRIERYIDKDKKTGKPKALLSPQMCQQCGNAGCEAVCPVYATYHNPDGLNAQIYNRCVGTRYCANNCVYKQRRFNWRTYSFPSPLHLQLNPDVSVRDKGVMEKCTFCVQRITLAKDKAKDENRVVFDGEIKTACQQTCPTDAIVFGNASDKNSQVSKSKQDIRGYHQLEETNFQPSITYLRRVEQT